MSEETTVSVNFGRPMPLFPLDQVVLLPHGVLPVNVGEEKYRQMVSDALDGAGQIAMAVLEGEGEVLGEGEGTSHGETHASGPDAGPPPIRAAVCIGQIVHHHRYPDGRYVIALQGICRAQITHELPPSGSAGYRQAMLEPVGVAAVDEEALAPEREQVVALLSSPPLTDLRDAAAVVQHLADDEVPTSAILELITLAFLPDPDFRYRFLAEGDALRRARMVVRELETTRRLLMRATAQRAVEVPKGCSWN